MYIRFNTVLHTGSKINLLPYNPIMGKLKKKWNLRAHKMAQL